MTRTIACGWGAVMVLGAGMAHDAFAQAPLKAKHHNDAYYLQRAHVDTAHAIEHARLAEEYLAMSPADESVREHASAIRAGLKSARRSYSMLSEVARKDAEISKKLKEIADREAQLLATADRIDPPVVAPPLPPQRALRSRSSGGSLRISQTYYFGGEGHFID